MSELDLNDPCVKMIVQQRVKLLMRYPFFGRLAIRLGVIDASKWCKTMAVDGRNMYFNREFVLGMNPDELMFVIAHEILHLVYEHLGIRPKDAEPRVWNMANDYIVNYTLVQDKIGTMPKCGLYSEKYTDEMSSYEVYQDLMKNSTQVYVPFDEHLEGGGGGDGDQPRGATITVMGDENGPPRLSDEDLQQIRDEFRAAVMAEAQAVGAGNLPAGVRRILNDLMEPLMDWRTLLHHHIVSQVKTNYSFASPNRRSYHLGVILPGMTPGEEVEVDVSIDASGSMTDEMIRELLSETHGIMLAFDSFKLRLSSFDTKIYGVKEFTEANIDEIFEYKVEGGGGTDPSCLWNWYLKNDITPKKVVVFTDGCFGQTNSSGNPSIQCPEWNPAQLGLVTDILWIIHGNDKLVAPTGQTAYYPKG